MNKELSFKPTDRRFYTLPASTNQQDNILTQSKPPSVIFQEKFEVLLVPIVRQALEPVKYGDEHISCVVSALVKTAIRLLATTRAHEIGKTTLEHCGDEVRSSIDRQLEQMIESPVRLSKQLLGIKAHYMHIHTGTVQTAEEWRDDYEDMSHTEWFGKELEQCKKWHWLHDATFLNEVEFLDDAWIDV